MTDKEIAVSDVIAVILMVAIIFLTMGILAVFLFSNVSVDIVPEVDLSFSEFSTDLLDPDNTRKLVIYMQRGESLDWGSTRITIIPKGGGPITIEPDLKKQGWDNEEPWKNHQNELFSIGDRLIYNWDPSWSEITVNVVLIRSTGEILIDKSIIGI